MDQNNLLRPSRAAIRMKCPGSYNLEKNVKDIPSKEALEGTIVHRIIQELFDNFDQAIIYNKKILGLCEEANIPLTTEMIECAKLFVHHVSSQGTDIHVEEFMTIENIHSNCAGTPDAWFIKECCLYLYDFKYGHKYIDVIENWQLIEYAAGILKNISGVSNIKEVIFCIVQPRCYSASTVRTWKAHTASLLDYFDKLKIAEKKAMQFDAPRLPSTICKLCKAKNICPELTDFAANLLQELPNNLVPLKSEDVLFTGAYLKELLEYKEIFEAHIDIVQETIKHQIKTGKFVEFFELSQSLGHRKWSSERGVLKNIGDLFGVNLAVNDLISPAQAIKNGMPEEIVNSHSTRELGQPKLTLINATKVKEKFSN
jgi:hypothetical protein